MRKKIAVKLREIAHKIDPQPYVEETDDGWTIRTKTGIGLARISPGSNAV